MASQELSRSKAAQPVLVGILGILLAIEFGAYTRAQAQLDAENLIVIPPDGWKIGYQSSHDTRSITEFVPAIETVDDWTQMLTVQIFRHATVDSATFVKGLAQRYMNDCPGTTAKGIFTGTTNGYVVSMLLLKCPKNPGTGKPETTALRFIKGQDALYGVQRAWRAVPSDVDLDTVMHALAQVTVCDTRTPEHPCPGLGSPIPNR